MGYRELINSLHKEADRKTKSIWDAVKTEAEKIRTEADEKTSRMKSLFSKRQAEEVRKQEDLILRDVEKKARTLRLSAENELSARLLQTAVSCLPELRNERYKNIFASLTKELPSVKPERIGVNQEDAGIAREYFPDADIDARGSISGGLEIELNDGKTCITNTFEKRLERSWEDILPLLIRDIYKEIQGHGTITAD